MSNVIEIREGVLHQQARHSPSKLKGFYRALCKSHAAARQGGWSSAAMLSASIVNEMLTKGSRLWWDLIDLEFGSLSSPDSTRDEIGFRTQAGWVCTGTPSQPFMIVMAIQQQNGIRPDITQNLFPEEVDARLAEMLSDRDFPSGGLEPMISNLGTAALSANLKVESLEDKNSYILLTLQDPNEQGGYTRYTVHVYPDALLKDIDLIKASLATQEGTKQ